MAPSDSDRPKSGEPIDEEATIYPLEVDEASSDRPKSGEPVDEEATIYPFEDDEPSQEPTEAPAAEPEPLPLKTSGARVAAHELTEHPFGSKPPPEPELTVHPFGSKPPPEPELTVFPFGGATAPQRPGHPLRSDSTAAPGATEVAPVPGAESLDQLARRLSNAFTRGLSTRAHECIARIEADTLEARRALVATWWLTDGATMTKLIDLGVRADSIALVCFVPLVAAAWADGKFSKNERSAALEIAEQIGLSPNDAIQPALVERLDAALDEAILRAWLAYVDVFSSRVDAELLAQVLERIRDGARDIAEASGGFLGVGNKVSDAEAALLQRLQNPTRMTITPFSS